MAQLAEFRGVVLNIGRNIYGILNPFDPFCDSWKSMGPSGLSSGSLDFYFVDLTGGNTAFGGISCAAQPIFQYFGSLF